MAIISEIEEQDKKIKALLLPYDECDVERIAINLDKSGFIRTYSYEGKMYVNITNFLSHQNPHKNERDKGSDIPEFTEDAAQAIDFKEVTINRDKIESIPDKNDSDPADSCSLIPDSCSLIPDKKTLPSKLDDVDLVFDYWVFAMGKGSRAKKTQGRIKKIQARLAEGYSVELIKRAIDGCKLSPHHMGQNDQNKVYDDIDLICRSGEKLEGFIENVSRPPAPKGVSAKEQQRADKIQARNEALGIQSFGNQPFIDGEVL